MPRGQLGNSLYLGPSLPAQDPDLGLVSVRCFPSAWVTSFHCSARSHYLPSGMMEPAAKISSPTSNWAAGSWMRVGVVHANG